MNLVNQMLMDLKHRLPEGSINSVKKDAPFKEKPTISLTAQFAISFFISISILFLLNYLYDQMIEDSKLPVENLSRYSSYLAPSSIEMLMDSKDIGLNKIKHISKNELFYSSVDQVSTIASLIEKNRHLISSGHDRSSLVGKVKRESDLVLHRIVKEKNEDIGKIRIVSSLEKKPQSLRDRENSKNSVGYSVIEPIDRSDQKVINKLPNTEKFEKIEVSYLNVERSETSYRKAIGSLREGNVSDAKKMFKQALKISPTHLKSSEALVGILMNENDWIGTEKILVAGIDANRENISLTMWLAQLYLQQEREPEAIELLSRNAPYAKENGDYYALMAVLHQNAGDFDLALVAYKKALKTNRSISRWWFGLAVVLEFQSNWLEAQSAYVRALGSGDLPVELLTYAEQRLSFVESQIDDF